MLTVLTECCGKKGGATICTGYVLTVHMQYASKDDFSICFLMVLIFIIKHTFYDLLTSYILSQNDFIYLYVQHCQYSLCFPSCTLW
jgi:hypothetical protein